MSERDQAGRSSVGTKNQKQITSTCRTVDLEMFAHHVPDHTLWRLSMKRLTALVSDVTIVTLKNLQDRLDRLTGSNANLHLGLVKALLHPADMRTACHNSRAVAVYVSFSCSVACVYKASNKAIHAW